jgi:hypothetical protein
MSDVPVSGSPLVVVNEEQDGFAQNSPASPPY